MTSSFFTNFFRGSQSLLRIFPLFLLALFFSTPSVQAAVCTYASTEDTHDFNLAANWDCGFVPGASSTAIVTESTSTALTAPTTLGALQIISGSTVITTGRDLTVLGTITSPGTLVAGANTTTIGGNFNLTNGSFSPGDGTVVFATSSARDHIVHTSADSSFNNITVSSTGNLVGFFDGNLYTVSGDVRVVAGVLQVRGTSRMLVNGLLEVALSTRVANDSGSLMTVNSTTTNHGEFCGNSGLNAAYLFNDDVINTGTIDSSCGNIFATFKNIFTFKKSFTSVAGGFNPSSSTVIFSGSADQVIPADQTFYNLTVSTTGGVASLGGSVSSTGAFTVGTSTTLAVGNNTLRASGTYTNPGLISVGASGSIIHPIELFRFTDGTATQRLSYSTPGSVYLRVTDSDRNLDGTVAETITVPVTVNGAGGADSETLTLTETGVATGIFQSNAVNLVTSISSSPGNGKFEIIASGSGSGNYTDALDATDTSSTSATFTFVSSNSGNNNGGGGGGAGGGAPALPPLVTSPQTSSNASVLLENLKNLGVSIHSLVKLPTDGNPNTQEDSAVYYIGSDGMRHAFPNDKIYFTWYQDFSQVKIVSAAHLASIPLGKNITYKPGVKMVKFTTDPKVYGVDKGGVLRWLKTETLAISLYGANWNKNIDDLSDAFFSNYTFGPDILSMADFNPTALQTGTLYWGE